MFDNVAFAHCATFGMAAAIAAAISFYLARKDQTLNLSTFAFWQALVGGAIQKGVESKAVSKANSQASLEELKSLQNTAAAAKRAAEARLEDAAARRLPAPSTNMGCSFFILIVLTLAVFACR